MSTVNISLPKDQLSFVDQLVTSYGFANRSEFVRSLIRLIRHKPHILDQASIFPFVTPKERSTKRILSDFQKTKRYSKEFLKDLKEGLASSDYFEE